MSEEPLSIRTLVVSRCTELGLRPVELIRRCGYKNLTKGLGRLEQLYQGDFERSRGLLGALPAALDIPVEAVQSTVAETQRQIEEIEQRMAQADEDAWRSAFVPHAIIRAERNRPEPLFAAFFIGVDRLLRVDFDLAQTPVTYLSQALIGVRQKLSEWRSDRLPCFGRPTGVIVNYTPDRAILFGLDGNAIEIFDRADRPGVCQLSIGRRPISQRELNAIFGSATPSERCDR